MLNGGSVQYALPRPFLPARTPITCVPVGTDMALERVAVLKLDIPQKPVGPLTRIRPALVGLAACCRCGKGQMRALSWLSVYKLNFLVRMKLEE